MNKKGFTLVELIVVVALLAIVAVIATPNIMKLVNNSKNEQILSDAKTFLSDVKYKSKLIQYDNYFPSDGACKEICANDSSFSANLDKNEYNDEVSCVKIEKKDGQNIYYIKLFTKDGIRGILNSNPSDPYVSEEDLNKDSVVRLK